MDTRIPVNEKLYLSPPAPTDIPALVAGLNDKELFDRTLMIPFPYTAEDARLFLGYCQKSREKFGVNTEWSVRLADGALIGGVGVSNLHRMRPHVCEVGYWIAKPYRGQGVMTQALGAYCRFLQEEMGLLRIEAPVYAFNTGSQRVLEKCGFKEEGYLRKAYFKNEKYVDGKLFALVI